MANRSNPNPNPDPSHSSVVSGLSAATTLQDADVQLTEEVSVAEITPTGTRTRGTFQSSRVITNPREINIYINVSQFTPEEISIVVDGNILIVSGTHGDILDPQGSVARHFTRRYILPLGVDPNTVTALYQPDGILAIDAPINPSMQLPPNERNVPIEYPPER